MAYELPAGGRRQGLLAQHRPLDELPSCAKRITELVWQPDQLVGADKIALGTIGGLQVRAIGATIAALVQHEDVEMRAIAQRTVDPAGLDDAFAHRIHLVEGAGRAAASNEMSRTL